MILVLESGAIKRKTLKLAGPFRKPTRYRHVDITCKSAARRGAIAEASTELTVKVTGRRQPLVKVSKAVDWTALCPAEAGQESLRLSRP